MSQEVLVDVRNLTLDYTSRSGLVGRNVRRVRVLEDLSLAIHRGETLGVVGESGCGKTSLANCLLRLVTPAAGQVLFEGQDILALKKPDLRRVRREIQMVFQNPFSSLNPRMNVMDIVAEPLVTHTELRGAQLRKRVDELLVKVGLGTEHIRRHPHEMSGGQAQRVAVARALALNPKFIILDEPTSALDVSVQAQIVNLLVRLQSDHGLTYLFITHALGVVQHVSDRIAVLYLGELVELGSKDEISRFPQHPYTKALFSSTPVPDPDSGRERVLLEGQVPSLADPPEGCRFNTRCPSVVDLCYRQRPSARTVREGHWAACHLLSADPIP